MDIIEAARITLKKWLDPNAKYTEEECGFCMYKEERVKEHCLRDQHASCEIICPVYLQCSLIFGVNQRVRDAIVRFCESIISEGKITEKAAQQYRDSF